MATEVKGPASYFPSIEKKYSRPIAEWKELIRASPSASTWSSSTGSSPSTVWATATPTPSSPTPSPRTPASSQEVSIRPIRRKALRAG